MRVVEVLGVLAFLAGAGLLGRAAFRPRSSGQWEAHHRVEGDLRRVYVRRGGELDRVGEVASGDPEYDDRFLALMDRARERAATLNSEP